MTIEILISEVLISSMLMSASASAWNSVAATPECVFMPTPTTDSLAICSWMATSPPPIAASTGFRALTAFAVSVCGTVKVRFAAPGRAAFCTIMSTLTLESDSARNTFAAEPGLSGMLLTMTLAWSLSTATPRTTTFSM